MSALSVTSDGHAIAADVNGSNGAVFHVQVYISRTRSERTVISGHCKCAVSMDCKHVAATLIAALRYGSPTALASTKVIAPPRARRSGLQVACRCAVRAPPVDRWLSHLRTSVEGICAEATVGGERIAYIFNGGRTSARYGFPVTTIVVRRTKAERWVKIRAASADSLIAGTARAVTPKTRSSAVCCNSLRTPTALPARTAKI